MENSIRELNTLIKNTKDKTIRLKFINARNALKEALKEQKRQQAQIKREQRQLERVKRQLIKEDLQRRKQSQKHFGNL